MRSRSAKASVTAGLVALCWASPLAGQEPPPGTTAGLAVAPAITQQNPARQKPPSAATPAKVRGFRWEEHPRLQIGDGTWIDFRARVRGDLRESEAELGDPSAFDVARRRVGVEGRVAGVADYQVEYEFSSDEHWRDVYVNYRQFNHLQVQAGKFKLPFSLDENTSSANLDFVYRSRAATQLAPGRDRGVMVHGRVLNVLRYEAGLFNRDGGNARTDNPDRVFGGTTTAGRATVQPFRSSKSLLSDLQFGAAFTGSDVPEGIAAPSRPDGARRAVLPVRSVGARVPPARRARSAMASGAFLGQGRIHPRPERARRAERGRRRSVSVHRNGLVCQRDVARDRGEEIERRR